MRLNEERSVYHCVFAYPRQRGSCPAYIRGQDDHQHPIYIKDNTSVKVSENSESSSHITPQFLVLMIFYFCIQKTDVARGIFKACLRATNTTLYDDTWLEEFVSLSDTVLKMLLKQESKFI